MSEKKQLQVEAKFNEKISEEQGLEKLFWALDFISNLDDEIGEAGGRTGENEKRLPVIDRKAKELLTNLPAGVGLAN